MSAVRFLWCQVCRTWRPVDCRGAYAWRCHRCDWDMRATVATALERYKAWRELDQ